MVKSVLPGIMWAGRTTIFAIGLAVILAVVFGLAATAIAGTGVGAPFNLGQTNKVNSLSTLTGSVGSGASLIIDNNSSNTRYGFEPAGRAWRAPMRVSSSQKVARLNADSLDGQDSSAFVVTGNGKQGSFTNINSCGSGPVFSYSLTRTRSARIFATASSTYGRTSPGPERPTMRIQLLDSSNTVVAQSGRVATSESGNPSLNISEVPLDTSGSAAYVAPAGDHTLRIFGDLFETCTGYSQFQDPRLTHIVLSGGQ